MFSVYDESVPEKNILYSVSILNKKNDSLLKISETADVEITVSKPLIDSRRPLKYTVQNMFDNNVNSSYVEDTPDNLIKVDILEKNKVLRGSVHFEIINGYGQNFDLYFNNNRVKTMKFENCTIEVNDELWDSVDYSIKKSGSLSFEVTDIYKGDKYNDTCISELNFFWEQDAYDGPYGVSMFDYKYCNRERDN